MSGVAAAVLLALVAHAAPPDVDADPVPDDAVERPRWSAIVVPLVGGNSTDGVGFGIGGEVFRRPPGAEVGFTRKITASAYVSIDLKYQAHELQYQSQGELDWLFRAKFNGWTSYLYAGNGGADVVGDLGDLEGGNRLWMPWVLVSVSRPAFGGAQLYGALSTRIAFVEAGSGSVLEVEHPLGTDDAGFAEVTVGLEWDDRDRWPLPIDGMRAEVDLRTGWTFEPGGPASAMGGVHAEYARWIPLAGERLVFGSRLLLGKTLGPRPFFEQNFVGGRWHDELGYDQSFTGYGRTRTRGDGAIAALVELRPFLFRTRHRFWDLAMFVSLYAEDGLLFDGFVPGPHLPTLGGGPVLLWQGATELRPFVAFGWRDVRGDGTRRAAPQFGLALVDVL